MRNKRPERRKQYNEKNKERNREIPKQHYQDNREKLQKLGRNRYIKLFEEEKNENREYSIKTIICLKKTDKKRKSTGMNTFWD